MTSEATPTYELPSPEETFVEIECCSRTKTGETACGDDFRSVRIADEGRHIAVLSDGLGSGIKASLLSNMTTTMALEFVRRNMEIVQSAEIIMDTLPVCEYRKISYATFTVFDLLPGGLTRVVEMDNPPFIHLRNGHDLKWPADILFSERWPDRKLAISKFRMVQGDRLIAFSDGVTQAGLGSDACKFGWRREGALAYIQKLVDADPLISARELSERVVAEACTKNPQHRCIDDVSCLVVYLRKPRRLRLLTGPPFNQEDDREFAETVLNFDGHTIICGGTTANLVARELGRSISTDLKLIKFCGGLPPPSKLPGVDLVTEGILTLTECVRRLESGEYRDAPLPVSNIITFLLESDVIEFIVGTKVNEAHQDPRLPVDLEIRRNIIKKMSGILEEKYRKKVIIQYF